MKYRKFFNLHLSDTTNVRLKHIVISLVVFMIVIALIFAGYRINGTGFGEQIVTIKQGQQYQASKTLWDWMQLLVIPVVLALVAIWFNRIDKKNELTIAQNRSNDEQARTLDNQRENALQGYFDRMSELVLRENLDTPQASDKVRTIARARTLTILPMLDANRKTSVLQFLAESRLNNIISLRGADFQEVCLRGVVLYEADLDEANLSRAILALANLRGADLVFANLRETSLVGADLSNANFRVADLRRTKLAFSKLIGANLIGADLREADLTGADLSGAIIDETSLSKAIVTDQQKATMHILRKQ